MNLRPTQDRALIEIEEREQTAGGIYLPDNAKTQIKEGRVVAVGPGQRRLKDGELIPVDVKTGDRVLFNELEGNEIEYDGKRYFLIQAPRIIVIIS